MVELYCNDATEIFLSEKSVDMFFVNPPYWGSDMEAYGGPVEKHINHGVSIDDYFIDLLKLAMHMDFALKDTGSAFVMLPNYDNIVFEFAELVHMHTSLFVQKMYIWDFSSTPNTADMQSDKMGIILHLHKGSFNEYFKINGAVLHVPIDPWPIRKYEDLGFVDNGLPEELYNIFVTAFTQEGDTIADIVGGTGTIISSGFKFKRNVIYNDISRDQYNVAVARLTDLQTSAV